MESRFSIEWLGKYEAIQEFQKDFIRVISTPANTGITVKKTTIGISGGRRQGKRFTQREVLKAFNKPITLVVSDELYKSTKEFYKDIEHITIMCASEAIKEQELISEYYYGQGIKPRTFNPRDSFEHIRKRNDKRIFRVK